MDEVNNKRRQKSSALRKIDNVYAFGKDSIDISYMAGETIDRISGYKPTLYNSFIDVLRLIVGLRTRNVPVEKDIDLY